jgi:hypothetical protein
MRLILSRKGFDSSYGGVPSPILPDGRLVSLPIPEPGGSTKYSDLSSPAGSFGSLVEQLTGGRTRASARAHCDPDLDRDTRPRPRGWTPAFGQAGAAARHLDLQEVGPGDLFLFFGWFRETEKVDGGLRFVKNAPHLHVLFGWLRVGRVLAAATPPLKDHPHFCRPYDYSRVYAAATESSGGVFREFRPALQLTESGKNRSEWLLPDLFNPRGRAPLSYHRSPKRWRATKRGVRLSAVSRGQEFVLDTTHYPGATDWAESLGARACC